MPHTQEMGQIRDIMKRGRTRIAVGCSVILIIPLLVLGGYFFIYPALTPDRMKGDFIDAVIVPQKDGSSRLWVLTDGSFNYISTTKTPGYYSVGRRCLSCKTWLYEYDPAHEKILKKIKIDHNDIIIFSAISYSANKVYYIANAYGTDAPKIMAWDSSTGAPVRDTGGFVSPHPELESGIIEARYDKDSNLIMLSTKDGRKDLTFSLPNERLYLSYGSYMTELEKDMSETAVFALTGESGNDSRRHLYRICAPRGSLLRHRTSLWSSSEIEHLKHRAKSAAAGQISDRVFLEGLIYHQDADCAIVIHLSQMGKTADRIMTCLDADGKVKWTVRPGELFDEMKIDEVRNSFSAMTFTKDKIRVARSGNLALLMLEKKGLIGFDFTTGKKLFTLDL